MLTFARPEASIFALKNECDEDNIDFGSMEIPAFSETADPYCSGNGFLGCFS